MITQLPVLGIRRHRDPVMPARLEQLHRTVIVFWDQARPAMEPKIVAHRAVARTPAQQDPKMPAQSRHHPGNTYASPTSRKTRHTANRNVDLPLNQTRQQDQRLQRFSTVRYRVLLIRAHLRRQFGTAFGTRRLIIRHE